jgi:uncharacterized membrane protein YdbT with pleckstrin-like domain
VAYVKALLSKNEQIIVHTRKHPIALLWPFAYNLFFLIVVLVAASSANAEEPKLLLPILSLGVFPGCFFFLSYLKWWNEEYFVTNRRVIQSEGIINKRVIDSSLEKVNDVVLSQSWVGRCLDFGDVEILTASEIGVNNLTTIRRPVHFKTEMLNQKEALGGDDGYRPGAGTRTESKGHIPDLISGLEKLWKEGVLTDEEFQDKKTQLLAKM